ncbi:hypothetical protein BY996DRAFT_4643143 [Phakopsora pachyrhizi]|nr:hypothetical protein BY996DRAFT_4643143 [Phakopsora pachyrhizi]
MAKIVMCVIPAEQEARLKQKYPTPPPNTDVVPVNVYDPSKTVESIKSQSQAPVVVIISNFFSEDVQKKTKESIEAGASGIPVLVVPQGLDDDQAFKFIQDEKAKAGK